MAGTTPVLASSPWRRYVFLLLSFILLFASFRWNIFRIDQAQLDGNITVDNHVIPTMEFYAPGPALKRNFGGLIDLDDNGKPERYVMMMALHRMAYSWISPHSAEGVDKALPYLRSFIVALQAAAFTAFIAVVAGEFGYLCAGIAVVLLALSNWLIIFGPDLYWACVVFFLPFIAGWLLGDPARPVKQQRLLGWLYVTFCIIKCLCGFDYITNVLGAIAVPIIYYGLRRGTPLVKIAARILRYALLSVAAFFSALLLQILQWGMVEKDLKGSVAFFLWEARRRTNSNGEGISNRYDLAVLDVLHRLHVPAAYDGTLERVLVPLRSVMRYLRYLSMGAVTIPFPGHPLSFPIGLFVVGFVIVFWLQRKRIWAAISERTSSRNTAWIVATLAALVVTHLWIVLANGHMTHTFFNAIVFYIPFLPMAYVALAIGLTKLYGRLRTGRI